MVIPGGPSAAGPDAATGRGNITFPAASTGAASMALHAFGAEISVSEMLSIWTEAAVLLVLSAAMATPLKDLLASQTGSFTRVQLVDAIGPLIPTIAILLPGAGCVPPEGTTPLNAIARILT